jgi:hypothetical protein
MRDLDASWTGRDDRRHVKYTRDGNGVHTIDSKKKGCTKVWHPQKVCIEKPPATTLYTTLILRNRHSR